MPDLLTPDAYAPARFVLDCRGRTLDCRPGLAGGAHVMGVLNVTPDSFSDGGLYEEVDAAVERAGVMLDEGAALIDVGGESTRPKGSVYGEGAAAVALEEERARVVPVLEALAEAYPGALLSIDTYKPEVARAALAAGAHLVNDITGLRLTPETATVAAEAGAPLVVMHSTGTPGAMPHVAPHADVTDHVRDALDAAAARAKAAGDPQLIVDAGFGFGKTTRDNLRLVRDTDVLVRALRRPVLVGISRKSTIGAALGTTEAPAPVGERLFGSLGATAVAVLRGATLVRTHDVRPTVELLRLVAATMRA